MHLTGMCTISHRYKSDIVAISSGILLECSHLGAVLYCIGSNLPGVQCWADLTPGQQGAALPPLCPLLQGQQQAIKGRLVVRPDEGDIGQGDHGPAPCQDDCDAQDLGLGKIALKRTRISCHYGKKILAALSVLAMNRTALLPETPSVFPLPEVLETVGGELGVAGGVLDVAVAEPFLDGAGIVPEPLVAGEGDVLPAEGSDVWSAP